MSEIPMKKLPYKIMLDRYSEKDIHKKTLKEGTIVVATVDETNPQYPQKEICKVIKILERGELELENLYNDTETYIVHRDKISIPLEIHPEKIWDRMALGNARNEDKSIQAQYYDMFTWLLSDWKFVPGGRIMAMLGADNQKNLTGFNCFVIPNPVDSRHGAIESLDQMTEIMARGGGVGINLSTLRPRHAVVKGVNGTSSGAVSWGGGYSYYTGLIEQGGSRRGALLEGLSVWHPDIIEFIHVKQQKDEMLNANLSILVTDEFMQAVNDDRDWNLEYPDTTFDCYNSEWNGSLSAWKLKGYPVKKYQTLKAKALWDMIIESNWRSAEPGIIWIERYNNLSNSWYFEEILCTNPCVTGDTLVLTEDGYKRIDSLVNTEVNVWNGFEFSIVVPKITGTNQQMVNIQFSDGSELNSTLYHGFYTTNGKKEARHLQVGDKLKKWNYPIIEGNITLPNMYTKGFISGDGTEGSQDLFLYSEKKLLERYLTHTSVSRNYDAKYGDRIALRVPKELTLNKSWIPNNVYTIQTRLEWLAGIIDADGTLNGDDGSIALWSSNQPFLSELKLMLSTLGVFSTLNIGTYGGNVLMPDGIGGQKKYKTQDCYRLSISAWNVKQLMNLGLNTHRVPLIANPNRNASRFIQVTSITFLKDLEEKVYCFNEPLRHKGCFNGIVTANCGEQGLPAWGVCNLGHINLSKIPLSKDNLLKIDWDYLREIIHYAVRFMDNVIDITPYFFEANKEVQQSSRRVGIGTMGLAELLINLKLKYGSPESLEFIDHLYRFIRDNAYEASVEISIEKGPFEKFDAEKYLEGNFIKQLPDPLKAKIREHGIRNVAILTQAPTGSTGTMCDTSTGIEPFYDWTYTRSGRLGTELQYAPVIESYCKENNIPLQNFNTELLPDYFVTAQSITAKEHILVMSIIQKYTDSSISKTVNCPTSTTVEELDEIYKLAYDLGCKGLTTYRDKCRETQVLNSLTEKAAPKLKWGDLIPKPKDTIYRLVKFNTGCGRIKLMIGTSKSLRNKVIDIYTIVNSEGGCQLNIQGEAIAISKYLRLGGDIHKLLENSLKAGNCPSYQFKRGGGNTTLYGKSCFNGIVRAIVDFQNGTLPESVEVEGPSYEGVNLTNIAPQLNELQVNNLDDSVCPGCSHQMEKITGCWQCLNCGFSRCE